MTDEEKKAVEKIDYIQDFIIENGQYNADIEDIKCFSTIKNLIEKQAKELEQKDKIIDEMAGYLASIDFDEHCVEVPGICIGCPKEDDLDGYMQCIKQYFEKKVVR